MEEKMKTYSTVGLVLGICGVVAWLMPFFGYPVTIIGIIFSAKSLNSEEHNKALAGLILSIVFLVLTLINSMAGVVLWLSQLQYYY